jgi:cyclic pyranopterin phosphate synthase
MDLRSVMRSNPGDTELLKSKIVHALQNKPERHYFDPDKIDIVRFMNMTGG